MRGKRTKVHPRGAVEPRERSEFERVSLFTAFHRPKGTTCGQPWLPIQTGRLGPGTTYAQHKACTGLRRTDRNTDDVKVESGMRPERNPGATSVTDCLAANCQASNEASEKTERN